MKKDSKLLEPGEIFFHPRSNGRPDGAIWLVVVRDKRGEHEALSLHNGLVVDIGPGEICTFDNVQFLDTGLTTSPKLMTVGQVIMGNYEMFIKALTAFFSFSGFRTAMPNRRYQMMELAVGMEGRQMKTIKDFGLLR